MFKESAALALILILVLAMTPSAAFADATGENLTVGKTVAVEASASTIWVKSLTSHYIYYKNKQFATTTYNENGLIAKHRYYGGLAPAPFHEASYQYDNKGRLIELTDINKRDKIKRVSKFTYDKENRLTKQDVRYTFTVTHKARDLFTYKYTANGRKVICEGKEIGGNYKTKRTMALNKKGYITSVSEQQHFRSIDDTGATRKYGKWVASKKAKFTYKYNSRGDLVKRTGDFGVLGWSNAGNETYKNRYNDIGDIRYAGRTGAKTGFLQSGNYIPLAVPSKFGAAVEEQQRALVNPSILAPRFGIDSYLEGDFINGSNLGGFANIH